MDDLEQPTSLADGPDGEAGEVENSVAAEGDPLFADPSYRAAVVDLLGALAYGELTAFSRLAADADMAPNQPAKAALARVAVAEFHHYEVLTGRPAFPGETVSLEVSLGAADYASAEEINAAIDRADLAMYQDKGRRKGEPRNSPAAMRISQIASLR